MNEPEQENALFSSFHASFPRNSQNGPVNPGVHHHLRGMKSSETQPLLPILSKRSAPGAKADAKASVDFHAAAADASLFLISGSEYLGYAFISFSAICFGVSLTIFRYLQLSHYLNSTHVTFLMTSSLFLFSAIYLSAGIWNGHISSSISKSTFFWLIVRGLCGSICMLLLMYSLKYIPAGDSDTILFISPIITIFLSIPLLGETITYVHIFAALCALTGSIIVASPSSDGEIAQIAASDRVVGSMFAITAAISNSITMVAVRKVVTSVHFIYSLGCLGFFGVVISVPMGGADLPIAVFQDPYILLLCLIAASCIVAGQSAYSYGFRFCPASTGSVIRNLEIPTAYFLSVFALHDHVTALRLSGSFLVVVGSAMIPFAKHLKIAAPQHASN